MNRSFVRIGKWFVKPYEKDEKPINKRYVERACSLSSESDNDVSKHLGSMYFVGIILFNVDFLDMLHLLTMGCDMARCMPGILCHTL